MQTITVSNCKDTNSNFRITTAIEKKKKNGGQPHEELMSSYQCFKAYQCEHIDISIIVFILLCVL